jgi:hypothetical protein
MGSRSESKIYYDSEVSKSYASAFFLLLGKKLPKNFSVPLRRIAEQIDLGFWYQNFEKAEVVTNRFELLKIGSRILDRDFIYLEFGVAWGDSLRQIIDFTGGNPGVEIHGFDTFEGLPDPHHGEITEGSFNQFGNIPEIPNVTFHKGLFTETFLGNEEYLRKRLFVMCDADLFSSTTYILKTIGPSLKVGDLVYFDDLHIPNQERLALDLAMRNGLRISLIASSGVGRSALFKVT